MPRLNKDLRAAFLRHRADNDRRDADDWAADQARLRQHRKATVAVVLKEWTTAGGKTARVVSNMGYRRTRLSLQVGERVMDPRKAALHLKRRHEGEYRPTGGYVGIRKPQIGDALAAAFVDAWWTNPKETAGRLAMTAYFAATGQTLSEQKASDHVKARLRQVGRFDIWKAAKAKSGRPSSCR